MSLSRAVVDKKRLASFSHSFVPDMANEGDDQTKRGYAWSSSKRHTSQRNVKFASTQWTWDCAPLRVAFHASVFSITVWFNGCVCYGFLAPTILPLCMSRNSRIPLMVHQALQVVKYYSTVTAAVTLTKTFCEIRDRHSKWRPLLTKKFYI